MKRFLSFSTVVVLVPLFSTAASADFSKEAWLAPERCTELVERSECENYSGGNACDTEWESHEKRMEFFVDDLEYLESQWPGYEETWGSTPST